MGWRRGVEERFHRSMALWEKLYIYKRGGGGGGGLGLLLLVACMLTLDVETIRRWARFMWDLKGSLNVVWPGKKYLLFEFESSREVEWVIQFDRRSFRGNLLHLIRWSQDVGCIECP